LNDLLADSSLRVLSKAREPVMRQLEQLEIVLTTTSGMSAS